MIMDIGDENAEKQSQGATERAREQKQTLQYSTHT